MDSEITDLANIDAISARLNSISDETNAPLRIAAKEITEPSWKSVAFQFETCAPMPFPPDDIKTKFLTFLLRYKSLMSVETTAIIKDEKGKYRFQDIDTMKAAINELRTIYFNSNDPIHYTKINHEFQRMLKATDIYSEIVLRAFNESNKDISIEFANHLNSCMKALGKVIKNSDLDYLYNGVLQHADKKHFSRFTKEYLSGELNYTIFRNFQIAMNLPQFLNLHTILIRQLMDAEMGGLL